MRWRTLAMVIPALFIPLSGCVDPFGWFPPDAQVQVTTIEEGQEQWNRDNRFIVRAKSAEPFEVKITASALDGTNHMVVTPATDAAFGEDGKWVTEAEVILADGTWRIRYYVDGFEWDDLNPVRIDATPPNIQALERVGTAQDGSYTIGDGAVIDPLTDIRVVDQLSGEDIAYGLPHTVTGLQDGIYAYDVIASDPASNQRLFTVQVRAGDSMALPDGEWGAGIVARYTTELRIWDLEDPSAYMDRPSAASLNPSHLGSGYQIEPDDPEIQRIVTEQVSPDMNTMEAALALYEWLYDALEYDEARLDESDLLGPSETIARGGGVCRDLAAVYVSLLRAADVPARVVTGYLGGSVDGFHAWVEFYAGEVAGQDPWVPVDVSPIDGPYTVQGLLQGFGILRPDYLTLRDLPPAAEMEGWSTVLRSEVSYHGNAPDVDFQTMVHPGSQVDRKLCVDVDTFARATRADFGDCAGYTHFFEEIPFRIVDRIVDYGISYTASSGDSVTMEASYPFAADASPGRVEYLVYGPTSWTRDATAGTIRMTING